MSRARVQRHAAPGFVAVEEGATVGATIGANVYAADGTTLFVPLTRAEVEQLLAGNRATLWELVEKVPPNVRALEQAAGTGLFAVTAAGVGAFRTLQGAASVVVTDGDGVAADPALALDGDDPSPGGSKYYGTDAGGVKGFHGLAGGLGTPDTIPSDLCLYLVDSNGDFITDSSGAYITVQDATAAFWLLFRDSQVWAPLELVLDGAGSGLMVTRYSNDTTSPQVRGQKARGSAASPAAVQASDVLVSFQARGYTSAGAMSGNAGALEAVAQEGFTSAAQGTQLNLSTITPGTTSRVTRVQIDADSVRPATTNTGSLGDASHAWGSGYIRHLRVTGTQALGAAITPAALAANVNDWAPTGVGTASRIRASATGAARSITGLTAGVDGQEMLLVNAGTTLDLTLPHDSGSSTAANRFYCPAAATFTLHPFDSVWLVYDGTASRWRVIGA